MWGQRLDSACCCIVLLATLKGSKARCHRGKTFKNKPMRCDMNSSFKQLKQAATWADLRVFARDLLHWSHDKDYRTLASFPAGPLLDRTLHVVRVASDGNLSTEVIMGALSSGHASQQIHLLVHQGHMRLLTPKALERHPPVIREVIAAGWKCHLEAAQGSEDDHVPDHPQCLDFTSALTPGNALGHGPPEFSRPRTWSRIIGLRRRLLSG